MVRNCLFCSKRITIGMFWCEMRFGFTVLCSKEMHSSKWWRSWREMYTPTVFSISHYHPSFSFGNIVFIFHRVYCKYLFYTHHHSDHDVRHGPALRSILHLTTYEKHHLTWIVNILQPDIATAALNIDFEWNIRHCARKYVPN